MCTIRCANVCKKRSSPERRLSNELENKKYAYTHTHTQSIESTVENERGKKRDERRQKHYNDARRSTGDCGDRVDAMAAGERRRGDVCRLRTAVTAPVQQPRRRPPAPAIITPVPSPHKRNDLKTLAAPDDTTDTKSA